MSPFLETMATPGKRQYVYVFLCVEEKNEGVLTSTYKNGPKRNVVGSL